MWLFCSSYLAFPSWQDALPFGKAASLFMMLTPLLSRLVVADCNMFFASVHACCGWHQHTNANSLASGPGALSENTPIQAAGRKARIEVQDHRLTCGAEHIELLLCGRDFLAQALLCARRRGAPAPNILYLQHSSSMHAHTGGALTVATS